MPWQITSVAGIRAEQELVTIFTRCGYHEFPRPLSAVRRKAIAFSTREEDQDGKIDFWLCLQIKTIYRWIPIQFTISNNRVRIKAKELEATSLSIVFVKVNIQDLKTALADRAAGARMVSWISKQVIQDYLSLKNK
ncbi:MAG: hypothetical protein G01um101470_932 [Parcubacteria group bacterium Gr01-1014_70]|nr:MAG: hypothetical protein G01um101470_932 [Parcubacteria group bacterium Gr01-1014_70]